MAAWLSRPAVSPTPSRLLWRVLVFILAFLSFACLLGNFYGLWTMHAFGCLVLPPATLVLIGIACRFGGQPRSVENPATWIIQGSLGGLIAAVAYDLYRLPFVLQGAPLFKVFPRFGELLLGSIEPRWLVQTLGWTYHFSNGAALGIMFLALIWRPSGHWLFWGAIAWAVWIEAMLLLTPYPRFFGIPLTSRFLFLTASAHLIFGIVLGIWCSTRLRRQTAGSGFTRP